MKVTDDTHVNSLIQKPSSSQTQNNRPGFAETLARSYTQGVNKNSEPSKSGAAPSVSQTSPVGKIMLAGLTESFQEVENTLGLLDRYAKALADPAQTLKQVAVLVKEMEQAADRLKGASHGLPDDHMVKELLDQTAIVATVEAAKFNRGDYI
ncbi:MAG: hypothetical protein JRI95_12265 [Deltaproteobacteria bacterium]|nr:hypothetical protein [Deltaproteobacteria bacterium]MBW2085449.1 hypothetical protein [Deltaproteobacteria bacterium]